MKIEVKIPEIGESITTGVIVSWLKHKGDQVEEGETLFELETDKALLEIPSPGTGTLEILVEEGTEVSIGQTVAMLGTDEAEKAKPASEQEPAAEPAAPSTTEAAEAEGEKPAQIEEKAKGPKSAPPSSSEPEQAGEQAGEIAPVVPAVASQATAGEKRRTERVPMSAIRRKTAERLVQARQTAAYLTTFNEIDMQKVIEIRTHYKTEFEKEHGIKIGFMSFFVKACCQALKDFPDVNARVDGEDIIYNYFYDIGVAISIERGLVVPIIRDADKLHFAEIETAIADLAKRAREKKLLPDELTGGTFTITNGGVFGSLLSTPIPAYPQSAIFGMHAIKKRPVVIDDEIVIRPMMYVALTYDHRVIDGRQAIGFLLHIKEYIEDPDKLLLEL
ncbi:MAG: 2-oxoglutarate dehydrogenase complex dihydrolipoyllysine-residue succinyltransferase [Phycisphaerae bacterium]|nr:2-oxoglutarate dehydrogenase complex dihydrolipoyllysine-residue succinyltransferase [Phycisphaerae bacterium]NIW95352.1 2-oxoglutarate dehydrogenase complex dihydrolipoyllysine-residue succinyltransferase [Phycisphaerae bacterium]